MWGRPPGRPLPLARPPARPPPLLSIPDANPLAGPCLHGQEQKRQFYIDAEKEAGEGLLMRMQELILHTVKRSSVASFASRGEFVDQAELEKRYKDHNLLPPPAP